MSDFELDPEDDLPTKQEIPDAYPWDDDPICPACNGSGEGQCSEHLCHTCHGRGTVQGA